MTKNNLTPQHIRNEQSGRRNATVRDGQLVYLNADGTTEPVPWE
jgi:hypothetical protein